MRGDSIANLQRQLAQAVFSIANHLKNSTSFQVTPITVAQLPAASLGMIACVTDHNGALTFGANVSGGGTSKVLAWFNGTSWNVIGI